MSEKKLLGIIGGLGPAAEQQQAQPRDPSPDSGDQEAQGQRPQACQCDCPDRSTVRRHEELSAEAEPNHQKVDQVDAEAVR